MAFWGKRTKGIDPSSYLIIKDRCFLSPRLDAMLDALERPGLTPQARTDLVLAELAAARAEPDWTVLIADFAAPLLTSDDDLAALRALAAVSPAGSHDRADAMALLATTLIVAAWAVRGSGRAESVGQDAWPIFHSILEEADEIGRAALDLVPGHPVAGCARLGSGRGLGLPSDEWWTRFDDVRARDPLLYGGHTRMLQAVCKKWYGNHDLMFDFARTVARESPTGSPLGAVLALAHLEYWLEEDTWELPPADRELIVGSIARWVAGGQAALAHPYAPQAHQMFAWVLRDDPAALRVHLGQTMGRMSTYPWIYMKDGEAAYRGMMARAGVQFEEHAQASAG